MNHGKPAWLVDSRMGGKGERRFFSTRQEAEAWAQIQRVRRKNEGSRAFEDRELAVFGLTVADAIKFTLQHYRRMRSSVTIGQAVEDLIASKRASGRSDRYVNDLGLRLGRLASALEGKTVAQITTGELESFLEGLNVSAGTRNTFRRDIRTLWSFAERRGWAEAKIAKNTERAKAVEKPPGILTPDQAANLLAESHDDELRAFHAIGLFAGLRVSEIKKLDWREVDFAGGFIHVAAVVSKTRSRRLVPIADNLRAWLQPVAKTSGPVVERSLRRGHEEARARAGIAEWPDNAMRHSFVSYRLAATQNAPQTALESGHDQAVLFAHYRELVRPKDAARYWSIAPARSAAAGRKIVALGAA